MSWSFPLSISEFWEQFQILDGSSEMELRHFRQQSVDGAGNMIGTKFGQPKWAQDVLVAPLYLNDASTFRAMIKVLQGRDGTFLAYDRFRPYPRLDPNGSEVNGFTVQVRTVGSNNRSLSLKGLPSGYDLSALDKISITDGTGKHALLEVTENISASGTTTAEFEVQPFLPTWIAVDQAVDLRKPLGKFKLVAGSYKPATVDGKRAVGAQFSMISIY